MDRIRKSIYGSALDPLPAAPIHAPVSPDVALRTKEFFDRHFACCPPLPVRRRVAQEEYLGPQKQLFAEWGKNYF